MARGKPPANAPCLRRTTCPQLFADWMRGVRLETLVASEERGSGPAQRSRRRTAESRLGSVGTRGNGRDREEVRKGLAASGRYLTASPLEASPTLLRLDGHDGNGARLADVAGFALVTRGKDSRLLDHPQIQAR